MLLKAAGVIAYGTADGSWYQIQSECPTRSNLIRNECIADGPRSGTESGERHQSAPSEVALTDDAFIVPEQNSIPALTHLQGRNG